MRSAAAILILLFVPAQSQATCPVSGFSGFGVQFAPQVVNVPQVVTQRQTVNVPFQFDVQSVVNVPTVVNVPQVFAQSQLVSGFGGFNGGFNASASFAPSFGGFSGSAPSFGGFSGVQANGGGFVPFDRPEVIDKGIGARQDVLLGTVGGRVLTQRTGILGRRRLILQ